MKKIIFTLLILMAFGFVNAQTDSLQQYTGKYVFPEGNPVTEIYVAIENGVLMGSSAMGNSEFKKINGDEFEIVAYGGIATFKRDSTGKVNSLRIQVQDLDMEGQKTEKNSIGINQLNIKIFLTEFIRREIGHCNS
jgi:hypothetical protein